MTLSGTIIVAGGVVNSPTVPAGYHMTFDDEFQTLSISDTNGAGTDWYSHTVQCCLYDTSNPATPTHMAGIGDGPGENPYSLVAGGGLDIRLQKTNGTWYSGALASVDSTGAGFAQQYGYFEMKANFPSGAGTWPAFWFLNSQHLTQAAPSGEIDMVEAFMAFPQALNTTLHDYSTNTTVGYNQATVANMSSGFHVYGMLWTATTMTFYFDGAVIYSLPTPAIMNQPYYIIIDLGLGGYFPTNQTPLQNDMIVQYMRAYSKS
jgi:beta-glucanase (GH16 family)